MREPLQRIGRVYGANVKIVEVPPGPPVLSPLVVEVYGIDYDGQIAVARDIRAVLEQTAGIVDIDDSSEASSERWVLSIDRAKAARLGLNQADIVNAVATLVGGEDVGYLHSGNRKYPVPLHIELAEGDKADIGSILSLKLRSAGQELAPLSEVVTLSRTDNEVSIYHKDLLPLVYVTADMAGDLDSPLYGMFDVLGRLQHELVSPLIDKPIEQYLVSQPENPYQYSLKWDGEWQITYETFRDMGLAYSVGLLLIYLLVVAQFKSYSVPLVIMAPIPLTVIGVLPGHALFGAQFTATSMIGMIALAGIIVRNSILLVDFIDQQVAGIQVIGQHIDIERRVFRGGYCVIGGLWCAATQGKITDGDFTVGGSFIAAEADQVKAEADDRAGGKAGEIHHITAAAIGVERTADFRCQVFAAIGLQVDGGITTAEAVDAKQ